MKICRRCNNEKEDACFQRQPKNNDGLFSYCKECQKELQEIYRRRRGIKKQRKRTIDELPDKKYCTRCKEEKLKDEFRIRVDKSGSVIINPTCRICDGVIAKEYYANRKDDPEFKKKNAERAREYATKNSDQIKKTRQSDLFKKEHSGWENKRYHRKRDEINAKAKVRRQTPAYKKMMKEYRQRNKKKIATQEEITKRRYHEKNKNSITDKYVKNLLRTQGNRNPTAEQIEIKRGEILLARIKKKIKNGSEGVNKADKGSENR